MGVRIADCDFMAWAEMAVGHIDGAKIKAEANFKEGNGNRGNGRRDDVAVYVMAIVGSVLWGSPASLSPTDYVGRTPL